MPKKELRDQPPHLLADGWFGFFLVAFAVFNLRVSFDLYISERLMLAIFNLLMALILLLAVAVSGLGFRKTTAEKYGVGASSCDRCGHQNSLAFGVFDHCAKCARTLCEGCMTRGCCGKKPAESGLGHEFPEEVEM